MTTSIADPVRSEVRLTERLDVAFLLLDGVRRPRRSKSRDVALCALGLDRDGQPRPLALRVVAEEDERAWTELLRGLRTAGTCSQLLLISCDVHPALLRAVRAVFPATPVQISIAHRLLALAVKVDARWRAACLAEARAIFAAPDRDTAVARFRAWRATWLRDGYRAVQSLESDLASCLSFYRFPQSLWPRIRTVNLVERAFREARVAVFAPDPAVAAPVQGAPASKEIPRHRSLAIHPFTMMPLRPAAHPNGAGEAPAEAPGEAPSSDQPQDAATLDSPAAGGRSARWLRALVRSDPRLHDLAVTALAALVGLGLGLALILIL